jgi:protein involved in polysaccharide export with SLBB domain
VIGSAPLIAPAAPGRSALRLLGTLVLGLVCGAAPASAQTTPATVQSTPAPAWDYGGLEMSRTDLQTLLGQFEAVIQSPAYSERLRADAESSAAQIRERLELGDFRSGDRIALAIAGEQMRSDTLVVGSDREITLGGMGAISLKGVLRSELQGHLEREIGRFIRTPVIRTGSLIRIQVQGAVGRPGFYVVPSTALIDDIMNMAGGVGPVSDLDKVRVDRNGGVLIAEEAMHQAIIEGRSVDQLNLRAGDQLVIPARAAGGGPWMLIGRYALIIASSLLLGIRMF